MNTLVRNGAETLSTTTAYAGTLAPRYTRGEDSKGLVYGVLGGVACVVVVVVAWKYGFLSVPSGSDDESSFIPGEYLRDDDKNFGRCDYAVGGSHWIKPPTVEILIINGQKVTTISAECYFCGPVWKA